MTPFKELFIIESLEKGRKRTEIGSEKFAERRAWCYWWIEGSINKTESCSIEKKNQPLKERMLKKLINAGSCGEL